MRFESQFSVSKTHPSLEGHFPENPIVPGVIILDEIFRAIESHWERKHVAKISFVKFIKPLRAQQRVNLVIVEKDPFTVKFICSKDDEILVSGQCKVSEKELT